MKRSEIESNHTKVEPPPKIGARFLVGLGRLYTRMFHDLKVLTPCQLPKTGPAILVCNHTSGLDPVLLQSACPRRIIWMMAKEYYEIAAVKWSFEMIEAIPVQRSGRDLSSTRAALRALQNGRVLGVFPEGRIETAQELLPFHTGVAMMARRMHVDVYPSYLDGTQRGTEMIESLAHSHHAILTFGPKVGLQFDGPDGDLDAATARIKEAVGALSAVASSFQGRPRKENDGTASKSPR